MNDKPTLLEVTLPILQSLLASGRYFDEDGRIQRHEAIDDALETAELLMDTLEEAEAAHTKE